MSSFIDTHCHLDLLRDPAQALDDAKQTVVVAVTELPSRYRLIETRFRNDRRVRVALGLHPLRAETAGPMEEGQLVRLLHLADYVGEVGLDFSRHGRDTKASQLRVFDRLLGEPHMKHKVISFHARGAERVLIDRVSEAGVIGAMHWFTGPLALIDRALAGGLYFSVNPSMMATEKGRQAIAALPRERVLTETDAPYGRLHGRAAEPADVRAVVEMLATSWEVTDEDARDTIHQNLARLYAATVSCNPFPALARRGT